MLKVSVQKGAFYCRLIFFAISSALFTASMAGGDGASMAREKEYLAQEVQVIPHLKNPFTCDAPLGGIVLPQGACTELLKQYVRYMQKITAQKSALLWPLNELSDWWNEDKGEFGPTALFRLKICVLAHIQLRCEESEQGAVLLETDPGKKIFAELEVLERLQESVGKLLKVRYDDIVPTC
jgi:hypothetical protein